MHGYIYQHLLKKSTIHVGKYASPVDPMGKIQAFLNRKVVGSVEDLRLGFPFQTVLRCMMISRSSNKTCSDVFLFAVYNWCFHT